MDCNTATQKRLIVETDKAVYKIEFGQIQVEITGRCNMQCIHCRAANETFADMEVEQIKKIVKFSRQFSPNYKEIIVSGGEPLMHSRFNEVMGAIRHAGGDFITLTTNGSLFGEEHLDLIEELRFGRCLLSVSLDNLNPERHDSFRRYKEAHSKAIRAIRTIVKRQLPEVVSSVRMTLQPHQIADMQAMAQYVYDLGCQRVNFSSVHPVGRAKHYPELLMNKRQKKQFISNIANLQQKFPRSFKVETNDPLFCLVRNYSDIGKDGQLLFDGCGAAAITFNVSANGDMTPCALLELPIMNIVDMSIKEMTQCYQQSDIVKNMLDMNLSGKCGECDKKYQCGGCRARAFARSGDYLAEDSDCWI